VNSRNALVLTSENVGIAQSVDSTVVSLRALAENLLDIVRDSSESISIKVLSVKETREDVLSSLFGTWKECGTEDQDLEELYRYRMIPSSRPLDEG